MSRSRSRPWDREPKRSQWPKRAANPVTLLVRREAEKLQWGSRFGGLPVLDVERAHNLRVVTRVNNLRGVIYVTGREAVDTTRTMRRAISLADTRGATRPDRNTPSPKEPRIASFIVATRDTQQVARRERLVRTAALVFVAGIFAAILAVGLRAPSVHGDSANVARGAAGALECLRHG